MAKAAKTAASNEPFDEELFETRLEALKDTQDGIQQMSNWCLQHRSNHKKIIQCWLNVFKRVRVDHRLVLFYLANDVIQYSKRKRYEFVECWATALQRATTMVRDERVKGKILRIFKIWEQREIYNEEYLSDLSGLLNIAPPKKSHASADQSDEFQNAVLVGSIRECVELSEATDKSFKKLPKSPQFEIEAIKQQLKDKSHTNDIEKEVERCVAFINAYNKNLQNEIKSRKSVLENVEAAKKFYEHQRGEVKVVASAYKSFGNRIKIVKRKLDEVIPTLSSPIPSPDINAPSPERDADLQLPDETPLAINLFSSNINGFSSYMDGGQLPFDINDFKRETNGKAKVMKGGSQPIEVIGARSSDDEGGSANFYKPEPLSSSSIPGLGSGAGIYNARPMMPPPVPPIFGEYSPPLPPHIASGYNSQEHQYTPAMPPPPPMPPMPAIGEAATDFNSGQWDMSMSWTPLDSLNSSASSSQQSQSTPHSPPHFERKAHTGSTAPLEYNERHNSAALGAQDVDHRSLQLPPAFNFGSKLGLSKDKSRQLLDIDHRNLISLTGSPGEKDLDVDYRTPKGKGEENLSSSPSLQLMAPPSSYAKKAVSPLKSNASTSSDSDRADGSARYDPADMVVDMDMSDEDMDESLRENKNANDSEEQDSEANGAAGRPALLATPSEFLNQNQIWQSDGSNNSFSNVPEMPTDLQQPQQPWSQMAPPWNGNEGGAPPPPRPPSFGAPPFPPFQAFSGSPENMRGSGGRGRGRGWSAPYRQNFQRMPNNNFEGNFDGPPRPFFQRGGGGQLRGGGRGRMRGNAWM